MEIINNKVTYHASITNNVDILNFESGQAAVFSYPSTNIAEDNQDSVGIVPLSNHEIVFALSDGAGGQPGGQGASQIVITELSNELLHDVNQNQMIRASVLNALETANKVIIDAKTGAGATACVVTIEDNHLRPIHVGDSMIAVVGQQGKLIYRSTEHSPLGYAMRSEIVAEKHLDKDVSHEVFNLVGNKEMHIEIGPELRLKKFDTLFMCSDGITDLIPLDECLDLIKSGPIEKASNNLITKFFKVVKDVDYKDDATFIIFRRAA